MIHLKTDLGEVICNITSILTSQNQEIMSLNDKIQSKKTLKYTDLSAMKYNMIRKLIYIFKETIKQYVE